MRCGFRLPHAALACMDWRTVPSGMTSASVRGEGAGGHCSASIRHRARLGESDWESQAALHAAHGPRQHRLNSTPPNTNTPTRSSPIYLPTPARRFAFSGACVPACQRASCSFARDSALSLICPNRARSRACRPGGHAAGAGVPILVQRCPHLGCAVSG